MSFALLKSNTNKLLNSEDPMMIYSALENLHYICSDIANVRGDVLEERNHGATILQGGKAVSPFIAAQCLLDPLRTVRFLRGIYAGIEEAFHRFPNERIHILYAGCGPYATLLLPLTTQFSSEQIQLTLIDIHAPSIQGVRNLIEAFELDSYIYKCVQSDAIHYQHPPEIPLHMVISETMQAGLVQEPQLAITRNFLPQLVVNGIFIPEAIELEACLSNSKIEDIGLRMHRDKCGFPVGREMEAETERLHLGSIMELNAKFAHPATIGDGWEAIPLTTVEIPERDAQFDQFLLMTAVSIFDSYKFEPYDCELSFPLRLHDLTEIESGSKIRFSYVFNEKPGLRHEIISV